MKTPKYTNVVAKMQARAAAFAAREFACVLEILNGSPIETVFVATMLAHGWRSWFDIGNDTHTRCAEHLRRHGLDLSGTEPRARIFGDAWPYVSTVAVAEAQLCLPSGRIIRPDFAFVWIEDDHLEKVAVELDGHDFHERTSDQAQADKSRDRELQATGWKVLRFTGREVLRRPRECLYEVERLVATKSYVANGYEYPDLDRVLT